MVEFCSLSVSYGIIPVGPICCHLYLFTTGSIIVLLPPFTLYLTGTTYSWVKYQVLVESQFFSTHYNSSSIDDRGNGKQWYESVPIRTLNRPTRHAPFLTSNWSLSDKTSAPLKLSTSRLRGLD